MENSNHTNRMEDFCRMIPKVELHAHINGSLSKDTLRQLIQIKTSKGELRNEVTDKMISIIDGEKRTLADAFEIFKVVHQVVDSSEAVYIATKNVIKEFMDDGVKYLELRSTPKNIGAMTKDVYMSSVLKAIDESNNNSDFDIITKFLVSIDRRNGSTVAEQTVDLAYKYMCMNDSVIGIDLSGDPSFGRSSDFVSSLFRARSLGLKTAVHLAESKEDKTETMAMLDIQPDRIGHGTCLLPEDGGHHDLVDFVTKHKIPLELCLTSNVKAQTVIDYDVHHFKKWYDMGHPCVICTDDKGVFTTSLSKEYQLAAETFQLDYQSVWDLSENAINCIFDSDHVKKELRNIWVQERPKLKHNGFFHN